VVDELVDQTTPAGLSRLKKTYIVVPGNLDVDFELDDTLTYEQFGETFTRKVQQIEPHKLLGVIRLHFYVE
jgi:hypothetical protein